jgi:hypothetical protein
MRLALTAALVLMTLADSPAGLRVSSPPQSKEALPGIQLMAVPDILYAQVPQLPPGHGLVVEHVANTAPPNLAVLKRHDVLVSYDGKPLSAVDQLQRLVLAAKPKQKVSLVILRGGKEITLKVSLNGADLPNSPAKSAVKPNGPSAVDIECTELDGGKLRINFYYYSESSSKLETLTCNGSLPEIEKQVRDQRLPDRVREMVDVAFKRLRAAYQR